jgi:hypothetical protein
MQAVFDKLGSNSDSVSIATHSNGATPILLTADVTVLPLKSKDGSASTMWMYAVSSAN